MLAVTRALSPLISVSTIVPKHSQFHSPWFSRQRRLQKFLVHAIQLWLTFISQVRHVCNTKTLQKDARVTWVNSISVEEIKDIDTIFSREESSRLASPCVILHRLILSCLFSHRPVSLINVPFSLSCTDGEAEKSRVLSSFAGKGLSFLLSSHHYPSRLP